MHQWRSLLYVPGVQERMLAKAPTTGADGLILDLEASVPATEKARARGLVTTVLPRIAAAASADVFVRVNTLASGLVEDEIAAVTMPGLAGIALPALASVAEIEQVSVWLGLAEARAGLADGSLGILAILESARAVLRAYDLLSASPRIAAALFGAEDFRQDMNVPRSRDGLEVHYARAAIGLAARAARVPAIDIVFTDLADEAELVEETRQGRLLGYTGKQVIHPRQIEPVHRALGPTGAEIDWARRVISAAVEAAATGAGAFVLDGRMIDRPVIAQAEQILVWGSGQ